MEEPKLKTVRKALFVLLTIAMAFTLFSGTSASQPQYFQYDYTSLVFNADEAYAGTYTHSGTGVTYNCYTVTYCLFPHTNTTANNPNARMQMINIKVPVSRNGVAFDADQVANSPILFAIPWAADNGAAAPNANALISGDPAQAAQMWLRNGWVLVEVGMRGKAQTKLPYPVVDMKAALRYLHYNAELIPGNTDMIFSHGYSSGGCGSSVIAASGNTTIYDAQLNEMGALPARDDVFGAIPGALVITRNYGIGTEVFAKFYSNQLTLEENLALFDTSNANARVNAALLEEYVNYLNGLGITTIINGVPGTPLTADTLSDYMLPYLIASQRTNANYNTWRDTYNYDWNRFWTSYAGTMVSNRNNLATISRMDTFNSASVTTNGVMTGGSLSQGSFGMLGTTASVFSSYGLHWIQNIKNPPVTVTPEIMELLEFQRNATDPTYFVTGGAGDVDVAEHWYIRHGTTDADVPIISTTVLAAALEGIGKNVNFAFIWGVGHAGATVFNAAEANGIEAWVKNIMSVGVEVTRNPDKMEYIYGEALDLTGMVVSLVYSNGAKVVVNGWATSPAPPAELKTLGENTILVGYNGFEYLGLKVFVHPAPVSELKITGANGEPVPALLTAARGSTVYLGLELNEGAVTSNIEWKINNPALATIDQTGKVTVKTTVGTAIITATDMVTGVTQSITLRII